jgi:hypothetical protein
VVVVDDVVLVVDVDDVVLAPTSEPVAGAAGHEKQADGRVVAVAHAEGGPNVVRIGRRPLGDASRAILRDVHDPRPVAEPPAVEYDELLGFDRDDLRGRGHRCCSQ